MIITTISKNFIECLFVRMDANLLLDDVNPHVPRALSYCVKLLLTTQEILNHADYFFLFFYFKVILKHNIKFLR